MIVHEEGEQVALQVGTGVDRTVHLHAVPPAALGAVQAFLRVRPGAMRRNLDHADARIGEDSIERRYKLTGPISDEEPELSDAIAKIHH
jgi:hypothetical protein